MNVFNYKKTVQALHFFASSQGGTLNKMKGLKLLWLSDRLHLRKYGRTISGDTYFAFKLGPVASGTRDILDSTNYASMEALQYSSQFICPDTLTYKSINEPVSNVFSKSDREVLSCIVSEFGKLDQFQLSEVSHQFPEWKKFEKELYRQERARFKMDLEDFFKDDIKGYPIFKEEQEKINLIQNLFTRTEKVIC